MVPDVVEELEIAPDGKALDEDSLRMILSESDDHALEQALILKETHGGSITAIAPEAPEVDDALFAALAKGAGRAIKVTGIDGGGVNGVVRAFAQILPKDADLILTGVQAYGDLDGLVAPLLAYQLGLPHVGIVTGVTVSGKCALVSKEFAGGVRAEYEVTLPAVLGIQAAPKAPRYVPVAKVRAAMKTQKLEAAGVTVMSDGGAGLIEVIEMRKPEAAGAAEMLEGDPEAVAGKICDILATRGVLL
jgi:electron transfer flavoprotein beta subunit